MPEWTKREVRKLLKRLLSFLWTLTPQYRKEIRKLNSVIECFDEIGIKYHPDIDAENYFVYGNPDSERIGKAIYEMADKLLCRKRRMWCG